MNVQLIFQKTITSLKDQLEEEGIKMGEIEKENGERLRNMEALQVRLIQEMR